MSNPPLLTVSNLCKEFPLKASALSGSVKTIRAVSNASFSIASGQTLGLVGESGCGKSTIGRLILRLIEPSSGSITLSGEELTGLTGRELKPYRRKMQIVFQDPLGSLNPRLNIRSILAEPLIVHGIPRHEHAGRLEELLRDVELPLDSLNRYPHEFSGGQRQRIAIARALALQPDLIVADEPVSALDASIQSQILMLLLRLQKEHNLAFLFISHDLAVVRFLCHEVVVMYFGEIVEHGPIQAVYENPLHPYTQALLRAIPRPEAHAADVEPLSGTLPDAMNPPAGCSFASRCPHASERCRTTAPPQTEPGPGHRVKCWLHPGSGSNESYEDTSS